jgi:putative membrane protein
VLNFGHWSASWPALLSYAVVAVAHLTGIGRQAAAGLVGRDQRNQALVFQGGLLLALLALVSPAGYWAGIYIWVRALQFLVLALVATGLMALGAPWQAFRDAVRGRSARSRRVTADDPGDGNARAAWLLSRPAFAVIVVNLVWLGWLLPEFADRSLGNAALTLAGHVACLAAGFVFWLQLIGSRPLSPQASPMRRLTLVVGTVGVMTVLGMVLVFGSGVLYPGYANSAHHLMTVLDDQQLAGAVLWMGVLPALIAVAVALLMRWFNDEESAELSADLNRLLTPRKDAWSARPGFRSR